MKIEIITLFPGFFNSVFNESILKRALDAGFIKTIVHDLRRYTTDKHQQADDYRFGGGAGMLLKPEPFFRAFKSVIPESKPRPLVIYPTPQGCSFNQQIADELAVESHLVFLCGHYKGVDQRVIERWVDREYSLGDFVVSGGEVASATMIDAIVRLIPGVLGDLDSALTDSFRSGVLDGPHYTRPEEYDGLQVPGVLIKGHHRNIQIWRRITAELVTRYKRSDLLTNTQE